MKNDTDLALASDVAMVSRLGAVPALLRVVCQVTGMGFAAVARVTDHTWTACAVLDEIGFGIVPGAQLDVHTTLCKESRAARQPVVIDHASQDPVYSNHHTPRLYNIESYISVPIVLRSGAYFGNLCAVDRKPAKVSDPKIVSMFTLFAELISLQLESEDKQRAAQSALESERATAELREQFIAVLGHDLRNPLMAIAATAEVIESKATTAEMVGMAHRIQTAARRMSHLIHDVMDFTRGRLGGGITLSPAPEADLPRALSEVVAECRATHPGRNIVERYKIQGVVECDRLRVQQVLSNLLANALSHGAPDQPVDVDVRMEGASLVVSVRNRGEPIAPENLAKVFEPYWRDGQHHSVGGLGLGLYICSQIAKAHGGEMSVTSTADDGTRFTARLPVHTLPDAG